MDDMTNEAYIYTAPLPRHVNEMVAPCDDTTYTIYLSDQLDEEGRARAYRHAMRHIAGNDFRGGDVAQIERRAHEEELCGKKNCHQGKSGS